jgi:hypothetical protein
VQSFISLNNGPWANAVPLAVSPKNIYYIYMEVSKELEMSLANDFSSIKSVEVIYKNGETVSGFVHQLQFLPLSVILCKHEVMRGEDSSHYLDLNRALKITLQYNTGEIRTFE